MNFKRERNGYCTSEVEKYINSLSNQYESITSDQKIRICDLKRENDNLCSELNQYKSKNGNISDALIVAVETAKQIKNSSKDVYELEIKRVRELYKKWKNIFENLDNSKKLIKIASETKKLMDEFNNQIDNVIKKNGIKLGQKENIDSVGIKSLISKMGGLSAQPVSNNILRRNENQKNEKLDNIPQASKTFHEVKNEYKVENNINTNQNYSHKVETEIEDDVEFSPKKSAELRIKPIANLSSEKNNKFNDLVEKFLSDDSEEVNAYSKAIIKRKKNSGFDLKEALNPTEDLSEIMKGFDFYEGKGKNGKK